MSTKTKDRRRSERVTFWSPVEISAPDGASPAALRNLSVAGLCCTTERPFPELSRVKIALDLTSGDAKDDARLRFELAGAVVRCQPVRHGTGKRRFELALYFIELSEKARISLVDLIRSRLG